MAALKHYRSRLRPNETDRVELGRQLASVLTKEESENFLAAIARQPVAAAGGFCHEAGGGLPGRRCASDLREAVAANDRQRVV